jgi:acetoacetyl-CoA synthetase
VLFASFGAGDEVWSATLADHVADVIDQVPSLRAVIALDDGPIGRRLRLPVHRLSDVLVERSEAPTDRPFAFDHPLYVLFSSGTTGRPKAIVHGAGGTLLEHVKEQRLHVDLRAGDRLFFQTSTAWMMWNWQLSALTSGASIVLHPEPVTAPDTLWRVVEEQHVTVFGTSPPYLRLCEELGYTPCDELALTQLRAVLSTGSILGDAEFDWVREHVGDVPLQSISGGTDIIGCFVLGNPNLPVHRGEIQSISLGLDVRSVPLDGGPTDAPVGELVCAAPFPSRPVGFVGDDDGSRFHDAYFSQHPGVWTHGDLIELSAGGGIRMHGRSDAVLNVQGIRIGPAEIYEALTGVPGIREVMAIEQETPGGIDPSRVVLLVVTTRPGGVDDALIHRIRHAIASRATPAHVPRLVVEVPELPMTHSGKRSERAARDALRGGAVVNRDALANPRCLASIREAVARAGAGEDRAGGSTEERLRAIWEEVLAVAPIGSDENFFDVGGTSLGAVRMLTAIHERMGVDLPLSVLLHAPTTTAMAELIDTAGDGDMPLVVPLRKGVGRRVNLVHGLLGDIFELRALAECLTTDRPVVAIQARGLDPRVEPHASVEDMAAAYVELLRADDPDGPYALGGYSFGGLIALEMARQLLTSGAEIECLVLIDTYVHEHCLSARGRRRLAVSRPFWLAVNGVKEPRTKLPNLARRLVGRPVEAPPDDVSVPPLLRFVEQVNTRAYETHCPAPVDVRALFIRARGRERRQCDPLPVLSKAVRGGLTVVTVPGGHFELMRHPFVDRVAALFAGALEPSG